MSKAPTVSENNKRIAKNTLMLYVKMGVMMLVSLYTSRVVLQTLGVDDFGIYNVVGGVVVLFSFLNTAMLSATQRFLNFELGKKDLVQVGRVFSMSMTVHFVIAGIVLILAETLGLWFLNSELNIPDERMVAANWVYQFSVASTLLGIMLVPYNATIIAYERMAFYAWTSILKALLLLGIVYLLVIGNTDKLVLYAGLVFAVNALMQVVYIVYCRCAFPQTAIYKPFRDKKLFRELISFSGWSLLGGVADVCNSQGINMVMNIFCGVVVNAAMGIANQVYGAVSQFVFSFQTAFKPQIVKKFAANEREELLSLVFRASRFSFFLMFILTLPICLNVEFILSVWLDDVPVFTSEFVQLLLVYSLISALSAPLWMLIQADGKIRRYQIVKGSLIFLIIPISYFVLKFDLSPIWILGIRIVLNILLMCWSVGHLNRLMCFPVKRFAREVICKIIGVAFFSCLFSVMISSQIFLASNWLRFLFSVFISMLFCFINIAFWGLNKSERDYFFSHNKKINGIFFNVN